MFWGKGGGVRWKKVGRKWVFREVSEEDEGSIFFGKIRLCISGKMTEEKLEEGDNSRTRISRKLLRKKT